MKTVKGSASASTTAMVAGQAQTFQTTLNVGQTLAELTGDVKTSMEVSNHDDGQLEGDFDISLLLKAESATRQYRVGTCIKIKFNCLASWP